MEVGQSIGDAVPRFTLSAGGRSAAAEPRYRQRRVTDVMSHSLGTVAVSPDGTGYVNDIVIRRNLPIPARTPSRISMPRMAGPIPGSRSISPRARAMPRSIARSSASMSSSGIHPTDAEVTVDVGLSYDSNGVVQVQAIQRDTGQGWR